MIDQLLVSLVAGALSGGLVQAFRVHIDARAKRVEHRTQVFFDVREYWRTKSTVRDDGESLSKTYGDLAPKVEAAWPGSGLGLTLLALADAVLLQGDTGTRKPELESEITRTAECVDEVIRALD